MIKSDMFPKTKVCNKWIIGSRGDILYISINKPQNRVCLFDLFTAPNDWFIYFMVLRENKHKILLQNLV